MGKWESGGNGGRCPQGATQAPTEERAQAAGQTRAATGRQASHTYICKIQASPRVDYPRETAWISTRAGVDIHASWRGYPCGSAWISTRVAWIVHACRWRLLLPYECIELMSPVLPLGMPFVSNSQGCQFLQKQIITVAAQAWPFE